MLNGSLELISKKNAVNYKAKFSSWCLESLSESVSFDAGWAFGDDFQAKLDHYSKSMPTTDLAGARCW